LTSVSRSSSWAVKVFLAFAFAYFLSAVLRAITATLAPVFSDELGLRASDLGLLAGAYFLGFSALQLPLGSALDRWGPRRVLLCLLSLAVLGCIAFAVATSLTSLFAARVLIGMGVAAGLMAPLTCFRRYFSPQAQLRANSWMLMTGSLGMLASTLPVQFLLPSFGWRGIFWAIAGLLALAMLVLWRCLPYDDVKTQVQAAQPGTYRTVLLDRVFIGCVPLGFFTYGGLIAVQTLWAGPWLTRVAGLSAQASAEGLFLINASMLLAFFFWGMAMPRLVARRVSVRQMVVLLVPLSLVSLSLIVIWPTPAQAWAWALWCVSCTVVSLVQPAIGQSFPAHLAGRALSAFNLVIFLGVFALQWGLGLLIESLQHRGWTQDAAYRAAFGLLAALNAAAYGWYLVVGKDRPLARAAA
jgi:predicted MFS family arabinose efflux permease